MRESAADIMWYMVQVTDMSDAFAGLHTVRCVCVEVLVLPKKDRNGKLVIEYCKELLLRSVWDIVRGSKGSPEALHFKFVVFTFQLCNPTELDGERDQLDST